MRPTKNILTIKLKYNTTKYSMIIKHHSHFHRNFQKKKERWLIYFRIKFWLYPHATKSCLLLVSTFPLLPHLPVDHINSHNVVHCVMLNKHVYLCSRSNQHHCKGNLLTFTCNNQCGISLCNNHEVTHIINCVETNTETLTRIWKTRTNKNY